MRATHFQTKFGGQPDWISTSQWPVSEAWGNRPMKFIGQIRLDEFLEDVEEMTLAYIFMTQPDDRNDTFYDPDIIFPDSGERHAREVQGSKGEAMPSKYPGKYRIDLHIDDDISVAQNGRIYGFKVFIIGEQDDAWVEKIIKEVERI